MGQNIIEFIKPDKHTEYMACAQYADWIPMSFDEKIDRAFIVQEIRMVKEIDGIEDTSHYYEAWHVVNGICEKNPNQDSHDLFCVGYPLDDGDALKESIGHKGRISFVPRVFLIKEDSPLYCEIHSWPTNCVREANGLRACYYTEKFAKKIDEYKEYVRAPFYHEWDFDDPKKIYEVVLRYCRTMFHRDSKIDRVNFEMTIEDFFPEGVYPEIKQMVIDSWDDQ